MPLHKLLLRQLSRTNLNVDSLPTNETQWKEFLDRINKTYTETDQERYLLERSMEISSREMNELNQKLETAQHIARLGYWFHDLINDKHLWSKELYAMFELDLDQPAPKVEDVLELVYEQDRPRLEACINKALTNNVPYEIEIRMKNFGPKTEYKWYQIIGEPTIENNGQIKNLAGVAMDIDRRKKIEEEISTLHQQLIASARRAGMADVATSVLHNIGNILNSANISLELLTGNIKQSQWEKLYKLVDMIKTNMHNLADYFTNDKKGKLLPTYMLELVEKLRQSQSIMREEAENLNVQIKHIKDITAMQKFLSGNSSMIEKIYLPEIIDAALTMCQKDLDNENIVVTKKYDGYLYLETDRSKLLQIMINLIQNAKDALIEVNNNKNINITAKEINTDEVGVEIQDNGIGISKENLNKIFTFGFTTKKEGHGFGLHSSAIATKELGGTLNASSDGEFKGTKFVLILPITAVNKEKSNEKAEKFADYHH